MTSVPAVICIESDGDNVIVFGGKQLKAGGGDLFPDSVKTQAFVTQSGPDHTPNIGLSISIEHGELHDPCSTAAHFQSQGEIIELTDSYSLIFGVPLRKVRVETFPTKLFSLQPQFRAPSIADANEKGMFSL